MIGALGAARRSSSKSVSGRMDKRKRDDSRDPRTASMQRDQAVIVPPEA